MMVKKLREKRVYEGDGKLEKERRQEGKVGWKRERQTG